ncbi:DsbA family oxidoreductase [Nocardia sp. NBC_01329]|uniref:DsbA family oxidoreductase n=1 Tax=Nocardia sp. NBC_01329 TaxID=2903594 RepID=UPI002E152925|nr:DsbA family oxidoreductase [Nocardia sp. NBC_01329]
MIEITVEIWSDVVCPWCYIGKRRFEAALERFEHRDSVTVTWRSFELDPDGPRDGRLTIPQCMQRDLGMSPEQAAAGMAMVTQLAAEVGLEYHLENAVPVNTFDAHRLIHFGEHRSLGEPVRERLLRGYAAEGAYLGDRQTLVRLGSEAGLDTEEVKALLDGDRFGDSVRADERRAARLGVTGVPSFSFTGRRAVSGALSVADILGRLQDAVLPAKA